ncbi:ATP-binding protein [Corallincola spongiicola]|uniref:histidine kinase n=1 Tax=Corallincola spongiicola TaxID=2520508 RepID=A0ABY1WVS1_9GAMM|nr:ATP-binding protein [Corallincola spongiicola]TAA48676.1 response regulator [Corallincola spongiicola]
MLDKMEAIDRLDQMPEPSEIDEQQMPDSGTSRLIHKQSFWFVVMAFMGAVAYRYTLPVFGNIELVCGNLFPLLLVYRCRPLVVGLCAFIAALSLWQNWDNPYVLLTFTLEAFVVSVLVRRKINLLFADLAYWLFVGVPATGIIIIFINPIAPEYIIHVLIKQAVNGAAYAIIAMALLSIPVLKRLLVVRTSETRTFRRQISQSLLSVMFAVVLLAGLVVEQVEVNNRATALQREMTSYAQNLVQGLDTQLLVSKRQVTALAEFFGSNENSASDRDNLLLSMHRASPSFLTMFISDEVGDIINASPASLMKLSHESEGTHNVSDRRYFRVPRDTGESFISGAIQGRGFGNDVIVAISAPILRDNKFEGIVEGSMNLYRLGSWEQLQQQKDYLWLILDGEGRTLFAADKLRLQAFSAAPISELNRRANIFGLPSLKLSEEPSAAQYLYSEVELDNRWRVLVMRDYQLELADNQQRYILFLAMIFAGSLVVLGFAGWFAHRTTRPIERLAQSALSGDVDCLEKDLFSDSPMEIQKLATAIQDKSEQIATHNRQLDAQIQERTAQLRDANTRLTESQQLLHKVLDAIPARVFWKDTQLNYLGCNSLFAADAHVASSAEIVGKSDFDLVWHDVASNFQDDDRAVIASGEAKLHYLEPQTRADGKTSWLETSKIPLSNKQGQVIGVLGTYQDVTDRIEREQALKEATVAAEAATEAKSHFLANMSHEIRTPMNAIVGLVELLLSDELSAQQSKYLQRVQSSTEHLLSIINDILDYSKIEAGKLTLSPEATDLRVLLMETGEIFEQAISQQGLSFTCDMPKALPTMMVDPLRLRQVLVNLLGNAVKFTRRGGLVLGCELQQESETTAVIDLTVRDTGIGMNGEQVARLFTPFTQADSTTTRQFGGTGLGLTICKQIINLMGSDITVESQPNVGSCFQFRLHLPVTSERPANQPQARVHQQFQPLDCHILLVDDNQINQEVAVGMLRRLGARVTVANNGAEAVAKLSSANYDLVFMDIQMPIMDGYQATQAILLQHKKPPPIVALTANAMPDEQTRAMTVGMSGYISKPVRQADLYHQILDKLGEKALSADTTSTPVPPVAAVSTELDTEISIGLSQCGQDHEMYQRLVAQLAKQWQGMLQTLIAVDFAHTSETVVGSLIAQMHSLRGIAGNLGARGVAENADAMECGLRGIADNLPLSSADLRVGELIEQRQEIARAMDDFICRVNAAYLPNKALVNSDGDQKEALADHEIQDFLALVKQSLVGHDYVDTAPLQRFIQVTDNAELKADGQLLLESLDAFDYEQAQIHFLNIEQRLKA